MKMQTVFFVIILIFLIGNAFPQNNVCVLKGSHNNAFTKVNAPSIYLDRKSLGKVATSSFVVDYIYPQPPASAQSAINYAVNIWAYLIQSSNFFRTIKIEVVWEDLGYSSSGSYTLAHCRPQSYYNSSSLPQSNIQYSIALAEQLLNMELNGDSCEMKISVNSNSQVNWYYGTDGEPQTDRPDLVSTALHEIAHGLGYSSSYSVSNNIGLKGFSNCAVDSGQHITRYDQFGGVSSSYPSVDKLMYYDDSTATLKDKLICDNVFFSGENAYLLNDHNIPKLYCPPSWDNGSSYSHLDDASFPAGSSNSLMTHTQDEAEVIHSPGEVGLAILKDLGWTVNRFITFIRPGYGSQLRKGTIDTLKWTDTEGGSYDLILLDASLNPVTVLQSSQQAVPGVNKYVWNIPTNLANGNYRLKISSGSQIGLSLSFYITDQQIVAKPTLTPPAANYETSIYIKANCTTSGATIRYNINSNSDPTATSLPFPDSLLIDQTKTIRVKAFKNGLLSSETNTSVYTIGITPPIPEVHLESGTYANPFKVMIGWVAGSQLFWQWTDNNTIPEDPSTPGYQQEVLYSNPFTFNYTSNATVRMKLRSRKNGQWSDLVERTFIIVPGFRVAQIDNEVSGDSSFGIWFKWNINNWESMQDTVLPRPTTPTDYTILAQQNYKSDTYRKYKYWLKNNSQYEYVNHAQINVDNSTSSVLAYFNNTANITVKNSLESLANSTGGFINIKDPWFIDDSTDYRGTRNRGLNPNWNEQSSPFNVFQSSYYKGIFLNQRFDIPNNPYYSVKVDAVQEMSLNTTGIPTGRNHKFYFQNWSANDTSYASIQNINLDSTGIVFKRDGATIQANLKGTQLTRSNFNNVHSGQRGFIKDNFNGYLHNIYESYGQIWYERSADNGATWLLMNNGKPINSYGNAKSPSVCENSSLNLLYIVYQSEAFPYDGLVVTQYSLAQNANTPNWSQSICLMSDFNYSNDYQPVIASMSTWSVVVCNPPSTSAAGLRAFNVYTNSTNNSFDHCSEFSLPNVDQNSSNPSIVAGCQRFHLVYEQSQTSIRYYAWNASPAVSSVVSSGSSAIFNLQPVISLLNCQYPIVSWIGATYNYLGGYYPTNVLTRVGTSSGIFTGSINSVNGQIQSVSNASNDLTQQKTLITWSALSGSNKISKWQKRDGTTYTTPASMMNGAYYINGLSTQAATDANFLSPQALVFNTGATINYFIPSTTNFVGEMVADGSTSSNCQTNVFLGKISEEDTILTFGRSGVASIKDIEFVFEIGDIVVGDSIIRFIEIPDTITYSSTTKINLHTRTNNFILSPQTNFYFSNIYFVVQKSDPDTALSTNDLVNFKVELVHAITDQVVGTFDNITYNKNNLEKFANIDYSVDCSGIATGEYYLRLVTNVNGIANYTLANIFNDNTTLSKKNFNKVNFTGSEIPITYELSNNFPNPFNPSTTIRYQIPQDGIVTLKIYDILGSEVATLVNEEKIAGKYEVNFNASSLASGVYIYKIQAGSFINSKKMILLK